MSEPTDTDPIRQELNAIKMLVAILIAVGIAGCLLLYMILEKLPNT